MRRSISKAGLWALAALLAGCDTDAIAPPAPKRPRTASSSTAGAMPSRAKEVVLILPAGGNSDLTLYDLVARNEAGIDRVVYRSLRPAPGAGASAQAELIRQAAESGASALIVVPDDAKETADALAAIDAKKTPLVILGRTPAGGPPASATAVSFEPFTVSAKTLAESVAEGLKTIGAPEKSSVILLTRSTPDETAGERDGALMAALQQVGAPIAATVRYNPESGDAEKALSTALKDHPEAWAVIADDDAGILAAHTARRALGTRSYVVAGYFAMRNNMTSLMNGQVAALGDRDVEGLVRRAVQTAVALAGGESGEPKVVVPIKILRGHLVEPGTASPGALPSAAVVNTDALLTPPKPVEGEKKEAEKKP